MDVFTISPVICDNIIIRGLNGISNNGPLLYNYRYNQFFEIGT